VIMVALPLFLRATPAVSAAASVRPASTATVAPLPLHTVGEVCKCSESPQTPGELCAICLSPFLPSDEVLVMGCNHVYHGHCIATWLNVAASCPKCRMRVIPKTDEWVTEPRGEEVSQEAPGEPVAEAPGEQVEAPGEP